MYRNIVAMIASRKFFYAVLALLILQAAWLALSGRYPMAFDENYHLGVIKLYAHHLSPIWSGQPAYADTYGAVSRDPSYLYHYLMSFPYRLVSWWIHSTTTQIIVLRFMNIAMFAVSLPLYRKLLLKVGVAQAAVNAILLLFVLMPVVPLLAAQINYDNLILPLTAASLLLTEQISVELRSYKRLNTGRILGLAILGLAASLVKYPFLPIFLAIVIFLLAQSYRQLGLGRKFWLTLGFGWTLINKRARWLLVLMLVVFGFLFIERYGLNLLRYHTPTPACDKVLNTERCSAYGPWNRDYNFKLIKKDPVDGPLRYSGDWFYGMWLRTFFAVDGPATQFETRGPLILPSVGAIVFAGVGLVLLLTQVRRVRQHYNLGRLMLLCLVVVFYIGALWVDNYAAYVRTGQPVAINGRYLLVVYPVLLMLVAIGYVEALRKHPRLKLLLAGSAVICMLWGGGALTYIIRSRDAWLWPNSTVTHVNYDVRQWLSPVVPGSADPILFLPRT